MQNNLPGDILVKIASVHKVIERIQNNLPGDILVKIASVHKVIERIQNNLPGDILFKIAETGQEMCKVTICSTVLKWVTFT